MGWKELLRRNKPILEVLLALAGLVATTLLSIMAITLTRAANRIAAANLQVAERQATLAEIQLQPRFRFEFERSDSERGPHDVLRIFNDGAPVDALFVHQAVFLEVDIEQSRPESGESGMRLVPIYYFGDREYTGQRTELLATMSSLWSPPHFSPHRNATLEVDVIADSLRLSADYVGTRLRIFLIIDYEDASGFSHVVTYDLNPDWSLHSPNLPRVLRGREQADRIQSIFEMHIDMYTQLPEDLAKLTAESVLERWENYPKGEALW